MAIYPWKRFWCSREGSYRVDFQGYLSDPEESHSEYFPTAAITLSELVAFPCLILLGEPGAGKSTIIRDHPDWANADAGDFVLFKNLNEYSSEDRLVREIFECDVFSGWKGSDRTLHLVLDSFDECLSLIPTLPQIILARLRESHEHLKRIKLRIGCRTADWPSALEKEMVTSFEVKEVGVYELLPLRRRDVESAATLSDVPAEAFLSEVEKKNVVPFATKPVSLQMLLEIWKTEGALPPRQTDIYEMGCRLLANETNKYRRTKYQQKALKAKQRLAVAARIAASLVVCQKGAVSLDPILPTTGGKHFALETLASGTEQIEGERFAIDVNDLRQVLGSSLFSARGRDALGFSHQTYGEFLAAYYLAKSELSDVQILSLIAHTDAIATGIIPALQSAASWIACLRPSITEQILQIDPIVILRTDGAVLDSELRRRLVDIVLLRIEEFEAVDRSWELRKHYVKLRHPTLSGQLEPYIRDRRKSPMVRRAAVVIARECELRDLLPLFCRITKDKNQDIWVRIETGYAVKLLGTEKDHQILKTFALKGDPADTWDQLKCLSLKTLWPDSMSAKELFSNLVPPTRSHHVGEYWSFLSTDLAASLKNEHLLEALRWVQRSPASFTLHSPLSDLMGGIMLKGWEYMEDPRVHEEFVRAVISRVNCHDKILGAWYKSKEGAERIKKDNEKRRRLAKALIARLPEDDSFTVRLVFSDPPLVSAEDLDWLLSSLGNSKTDRERRRWAKVLSRLHNTGGRTPDEFDAVYHAAMKCPVLRKEVRWLWDPIPLDSELARQNRVAHLEAMILEIRTRKAELRQPWQKEEIPNSLRSLESGDLSAWWKLCRFLCATEGYGQRDTQLNPDLTQAPGWRHVDSAAEARVLRGAERYLLESEASPGKWLGKNKTYWPDMWAAKAFWLLSRNQSWLHQLGAEVWRKWAVALIADQHSIKEDQKDRDALLRLHGWTNAPQECADAVLALLRSEARTEKHLRSLKHLPPSLDPAFQQRLLGLAKSWTRQPSASTQLLAELSRRGVREAAALLHKRASRILRASKTDTTETLNQALSSAIELIVCERDGCWTLFEKILLTVPDYGKQLIQQLASHSEHPRGEHGFLSRLPALALSDLYIWLHQAFPIENDPDRFDSPVHDERSRIRDFREAVLGHLRQGGTKEHMKGLRRIVETIPGIWQLKYWLAEARGEYLQKVCAPPGVAELQRLLASRHGRLIRNAEELRSFLLESLARYEDDLHAGPNPTVPTLWNTGKDPSPKLEDELSDSIARHFRKDLKEYAICAHREVGVRTMKVHPKGESIDIYVTAPLETSPGEVPSSATVLVEAKGCWNREVWTAMETQLTERYLKNNSADAGIYVVGWYDCEKWKKNQPAGRKQCKGCSIEEARERLDTQARALSTQGRQVSAFVINTALN